jgi:hypothetical protein
MHKRLKDFTRCFHLKLFLPRFISPQRVQTGERVSSVTLSREPAPAPSNPTRHQSLVGGGRATRKQVPH